MTAIPPDDDIARIASISAAIIRQRPDLQCPCGTVSTMVIITHGDSTRVGFTPSDQCADDEAKARRELADILVEVAASFSASIQEDDASGIDR